MTNQLTARVYVRVSTVNQAEDGISIETQEKRLRSHCDYKGYNLIKVYIDAGISAKDRNRPQLQQLFSEIQKDEFFIVCDLSRFSRNTKDALIMLEELETKGVHFICLTPELDFSTPMGRCMFRMLMCFHELERDTISMNVSANMQRISREGKLRSRCPFGWKFVGKDKDLEPIKEQQETLCKILKLYDEGVKIAVIARKLNEDGDNKCLHLNKKEKDKEQIFYPETVKNILKNHRQLKSDKPVIPIEKRIISHHKTSETPSSSESNIIHLNGSGPIIEIVQN